jgi:hypothetical protein
MSKNTIKATTPWKKSDRHKAANLSREKPVRLLYQPMTPGMLRCSFFTLIYISGKLLAEVRKNGLPVRLPAAGEARPEVQERKRFFA